MKRTLKLVVIITLVLPALAFAGAGSGEAAATGGTEIVEISMANWDIANSFPDGAQDPLKNWIEDRFKIKINPLALTWGDANEKLNIWAASGQLPDVFGGIATVGDGRYYQWIEDGVIKALPDNLAKYPNVAKYTAIPEVTAFDVDGKTYLLPRMTYEDSAWWAMDRGILVRKDWMDKMGIKDPTNADEFINMAVRFTKEDPDGNGKNDTMGVTAVGTWIFYSQCFTGYGFTDGRWMKDTDGKYRLANTTKSALELFKFARQLNKAGGLDPDFATTPADGSAAIANFTSGRAGILLRQVSPKHLQIVKDSWDKLQPGVSFVDKVKIIQPWPVQGKQFELFLEKAYWSESYIESGVDDVKTDRILQLYDYFYSDEGIRMTMFGIEGTDYDLVNGQVQLLKKNAEGKTMTAGELYPIMVGGFGYMVTWSGDLVQYINPAIDKDIRAITTAERDFRLKNWKVPAVDWSVQAINVPEKQEMSLNIAGDWTRFILDTTSKSDEELFAEMQANWRANGYDAAVEAITKVAASMGK